MFQGLLTSYDSAHVTDEMRAEALAETEKTIAKLDALRKRQELPVEQLPLVANLYGAALMILVDKERAARDRVKRKKYREWLAKQPQTGHGFAPVGLTPNADFEDDEE